MDLILARDRDGAIGLDGKLPWPYCKWDMDLFKNITKGRSVIMGRNTFISLNEKPLKNRINIVLSKSLKERRDSPDLYFTNDIFSAIEIAKNENRAPICIGGASVFDFLMREGNLKLLNFAYLTEFYKKYEGDTYFNHNFYSFNEISKMKMKGGEFRVLKNKNYTQLS